MPMRKFRNRLSGARRFGLMLAGLLAAGCVVPPPPGASPPPAVEVLTDDARASRYGSNADELLADPEMPESVRRFFGSDQSWAMPVRLSRSAADFFGNLRRPGSCGLRGWTTSPQRAACRAPVPRILGSCSSASTERSCLRGSTMAALRTITASALAWR
jgi:hypothetical protein